MEEHDDQTYDTPYPRSPVSARTPEPDARGWASPPAATGGWGRPPVASSGWGSPPPATNGWGSPPPQQAASGWGQPAEDKETSPVFRRAASTSSDDDDTFEDVFDAFLTADGDRGYAHLLDVARGAPRLPCPLRCNAYATLRVPRCVGCSAKPFTGSFTDRLRKLAAHAQSKADGDEVSHRAHRSLLRWLKRRYATALRDVPEPFAPQTLAIADDASEGEQGALIVSSSTWPADVPLRCEPEVQGQPWALLALMNAATRDGIQAFLEDLDAANPFASLLDIKLSVGRRPRLKLRDRVVEVAGAPVTSREDMRAACAPLSFDGMQRAALPNELHRVSRVAMADGTVTALFLRVGRTVRGAAHRVADLIAGGKSVLFLGAPGAGKSTALRDAASFCGVCRETRAPTGECLVVDASMELGGDGAEAHPSLYPAERYPASGKSLHAAMTEVLCNCTPAAMVVDELRDRSAAAVAAEVGKRGVQLIATAHARSLAELVDDNALAPVLGDFETVTLSDSEARRRAGTRRDTGLGFTSTKVRRQRVGNATFDAVVELCPPRAGAWRVVLDVNGAIDAIVEKQPYGGELRFYDAEHVLQREPVT